MHDDVDKEYDEFVSMLLASKCQSVVVDQFGESNDGHDESNDDRVVLSTIYALLSASMSAMSNS